MTASPDLTVEELTVRFGGLVAVDQVSLHARGGSITGLIGPNGAGKTTLFNACSGTVSPSAGRIHLGGYRLDHHAPARRASQGLGRTFQRMELFNSLTVVDNVALGPEALYSARHPWSQIVASRRERRDVLRRTATAMDRAGIAHLSGRVVGDLSTGQRRLVELARAIATPFRFLLLDEPSSGLDVHETQEFGEVVRQFASDTGVGVLLVEHDMTLVAALCTQVFVLDFGKLIFSGTLAETMSSPLVRAAYLGSEATAVDPTVAPPTSSGHSRTAVSGRRKASGRV